MIVIVSSNPRERIAFAALCESHGWPCAECDSLRSLRRLVRQARPRAILARQKLGDGYSDDVLALVHSAGMYRAVRTIVLMDADTPSAREARQIALGADLVQRDPVRTDVIGAYLARFRTESSARVPPEPLLGTSRLPFAGATIDVVARTLRHAGRTARLTPRETELVQILHDAGGQVVTYEDLYSEILGRRFRGDTSNMRVLLVKLDASFRSTGATLRRHVAVIPKSGYRYTPPIR